MDGNFNVSTDNSTGDLIIDQRPSMPEKIESGDHFENLAFKIGDDVLDGVCDALTGRISDDLSDQTEFLDLMAEHVKLLGVGPESEPDDIDYEKSDTSDAQLLLTAHTRFMAKATAAIMPQPKKVCYAEANVDFDAIPDPKAKQEARKQAKAACERVEDYYTDYLFFRDQPYQEDTDRIVYECGLHGFGIRKIYNDRSRKRNKTRLEWVPIQNMIFSYDARSYSSGRYSQKIPMATSDLIRRIRTGEYRSEGVISDTNVNISDDPLTTAQDKAEGMKPSAGVGSTHLIYEVYTDLFLDDDPHPEGLARPYVVSIHQASQKIVAIRRNWQPSDPEEKRIETFVAYIYLPGKRATQGMGLGHLLGNLTRSLRRGQRRGFDAAYLQNHPFGYKLSGMSIRDESTRVVPGSFLDVDSPTDDIRKALQMNMFQGPSPGLIQLLDRLEANGKELGGIATMDFTQMMKPNVPVGPALAAYVESTEIQTSIHRRLYDAHQMEMKLLHDRTQEVHGSQPVVYGDGKTLQPGDLIATDLLPVMKPGFASKQQEVMEAEALKRASDEDPDIMNRRKVMETYIRAITSSDVEEYMQPDPEETPPMPADPVSEYVSILNNAPVVAGLSQNHQAHIDTHTAQMRMVETSGMTVQDGERAMAALAAHVVDHQAKMMVADVSARLGIDPSMFEQGIPPELEGKLTLAIAAATKEVEAERAPEEEREESKLAIQQAKTQGDLQRETMKQRHEREMVELKHRQEMDLLRFKEEAETERQEADDAMALTIAKMKASGEAGPMAGTKAGVTAG